MGFAADGQSVSQNHTRTDVTGHHCARLYSHFTRQQLFEAWLPLLIVFFAMPLSYALGQLFARIFKVPGTRRGVFVVAFSFSNSMFIGFPVAQALFGDVGTSYAVFYYLANTVSFWTLGNYAIRKDADCIKGVSCRPSPGDVLRKLLSPPIVTVLVMFVIILLGIKLPGFVLDTARYLGGMTTPLSLIFMGCMVYSMGFAGMKWQNDILPVLLGRFVLVPALCFGCCMIAFALFRPADTNAFLLMRNVFTVQSGLPAIMQTSICAEACGADTPYATRIVFYTTLFSLLTIPFFMTLLHAI